MKERTKVLSKDLKVFLHFYLRANGVVELDEAGEDKKTSYEESRELIDNFLNHCSCKE